MYNGKALTAAMTATFQANRTEMTNERSTEGHMFRGGHHSGENREIHTKILGQESNADGVYKSSVAISAITM